MKHPNKIRAVILLIIVSSVMIAAGIDFQNMKKPDVIHPSESLSKIGKLSDYHPGIRGSAGDVNVYYFESGSPGANVLLLGGTHPNEASGFMAAVLLIETIKINQGKIIVIPQACGSGYAASDPMEGYPMFYHIKTKSGIRKFRFGSRVSNPLDQWPDPLVYTHYPSGQKLSGFETRNLNRAYPGRENGSFTEQVAYAIVNLIKQEKIDVAFDLHEAAPEIPIINAIVYHEKAEDIALSAVLELEMENLRYAPEKSPKKFRGLSHREWGEATTVFPFLMETCNPIQGRLRGRTNEDLIINGLSQQYKEALESGKLRIEYNPEGEPLWKRTARHIEGFKAILNSYSEYFPDKVIAFENVPSFDEIKLNGLGNYLR